MRSSWFLVFRTYSFGILGILRRLGRSLPPFLGRARRIHYCSLFLSFLGVGAGPGCGGSPPGEKSREGNRINHAQEDPPDCHCWVNILPVLSVMVSTM